METPAAVDVREVAARRRRVPAELVRLVKGVAGLTPVAVPPHVFEVDDAALAYGSFLRGDDGWSLGASAEVELPPETMQPGPLGGAVRSREQLDGALGSLLERIGFSVSEASLVVPDRWLRLLFTEMGESAGLSSRDEVLRWKLKKLVPYRVEDLRVVGSPAPGLGGQSGEQRVLIAFALDQLLGELETAFRARGVRLGQIASRSLYLMALLAEQDGDGTLVAHLEPDGYSVFFLSGGTPALVRYRALTLEPGDRDLAGNVARDLRILRSFLAENLPGVPVSRALVCGPGEALESWTRLLGESLDVEARALGRFDLELSGAEASAVSWHRLAPMLGAATREVA